MEIFGSTFDDSVFLSEKDRVLVSLSSYSAKLCEPEWFCESSALDTDDFLEKQKVYKFRGDLALRRGDYQKALGAYSSCLELIAGNNLIRRDVLGGMARCYTRLGHKDRAMGLVDTLSQEVSNTCHLTNILLLKVSIYQHCGLLRSKLCSLQQLCSLLPFNPWHWYSLAQTCLQLLERHSDMGSCCPQRCEEQNDEENKEQNVEEEEEEEELHEDQIWLKACTSFIRTRLLLRILQQQQSSFVLRRSESTLQATDEALQRLSPKETTLQLVSEVISEDLIPEKMREDYQDGESLASVCVQSFKERWWNKVLLTGVLQTDGHQTQSQ